MEKRVDKSFYDNANIESTSESRINIAFLRTKKKTYNSIILSEATQENTQL